jgi:hypothetical protein
MLSGQASLGGREAFHGKHSCLIPVSVNAAAGSPSKQGATGGDVNSAGNLSLSTFLFLFRQERAGRKRKEKEKEERERFRR